MEWLKIIVEAAVAVGLAIYEAARTGDDSILDKRVRDILPTELRTTVEKRIADARAEEAFGAESDARPETSALVAVASQLTRNDIRALLQASGPAQRSLFADELRAAGVPENPDVEPETAGGRVYNEIGSGAVAAGGSAGGTPDEP